MNPLPHLPVMRETYCTQEMTDKIIDLLWQYEENKDLPRDVDLDLPRLVRLATIDNHYAYDRVEEFYYTLEYIEREIKKFIPVPETNLGYVDLGFEMDRRICASVDPATPYLEQPRIHGCALNIGDDILPPLEFEDLTYHVQKAHDVKDVNEITQSFYQAEPDISYMMAEAIRRKMHINPALTGDFDRVRDVVGVLAKNTLGYELNPRARKGELIACLGIRIRKIVFAGEA